MVIKTVKKITSWSYSRYACYSECPAKAKYKFIDKLPEPSAPALERGNYVHKIAEDFTKGMFKKIPMELAKFREQFFELKKSKPMVEESWCFKQDWSGTTWDDWTGCWLRVKVDAACFEDTTLHIIDHKTGKKRDGYEDQLGLYALSGFLKFPHVKTVYTHLWYLDSGDHVEIPYAADQTKVLQKGWEKKVQPMLNDTTFAPRPGNACRFCHFSKAKGGPCKY